MREIIYRFADGTEVKSYSQATERGESFETLVREIKPEVAPMSEKRKEALKKKFGWA